MEGTIVLAFCAGCGQLLEPGAGVDSCPNCSTRVHDPRNRISGKFERGEAERLCNAFDFLLDPLDELEFKEFPDVKS